MVRKILLYGDVDLNIVDGSSVWLVNLAKLLVRDSQNHVDILLKKPISNPILVGELQPHYRIRLLNSAYYCHKIKEVDDSNIVKVIREIDELRDYSCMIIRGLPIMKAVINAPFIEKVIPYLTDFCHDKDKISAEEKAFLKHLYEKVKAYFVQTQAMKDYLIDVLQVDGRKYHILYPIVFPMKEAKTHYPKSIVYAGKIAKNWNISELVDIMEELYEYDPEITLHMIGDKFNLDMVDQKATLLDKFHSMPNIHFYGSLPRHQVMDIMNCCELGYSFRSRKVDHDHSLEVSVKLLEYIQAQVPMILRKTKMHEDILGKDYPLFVENTQECISKIKQVMNGQFSQEIKQSFQQCQERFSLHSIYQSVKSAISLYDEKKMRLLITGHDLKFIKQLYPYFQRQYDLDVYELEEYASFQNNIAKKYLKKADIVWCEWLLKNASWYSQHLYPHQHCFIRAHRFEVDRSFGYHLQFQNVTKVITVSYYYFEYFRRQFNIPLDKITVINNFIDTKLYDQPKNKDAQYHLALIGSLPKRKGLKKAIELLHILKQKDERYCLHVPGKKPEEFPNTWNDENEKQYYLEAYQMIKDYHLEDSVIFDGWVNISEFLKDIGYVLSLSDADFPESFHLAPFEGAASHAVALALRWEGIEYIYPSRIVFDSIKDIAKQICQCNQDQSLYQELSDYCYQYTKERYDIHKVYSVIEGLLETGGYNEELFD